MGEAPHHKVVLERISEILPDANYMRSRYSAIPQKFVKSLSLPHPGIDDLYLTRRARGQISGVEETIASLLGYDTTKGIPRRDGFKARQSSYGSRSSIDITSQLGVQPYTLLPSPTRSYSSSSQLLRYGSHQTNYQTDD